MNGTRKHTIFKLCVVSGLALAIGCGAAFAGDRAATKRKKANLFESLFGFSSSPRPERQKRRGLFGRSWEDDRGDDVRIISGQQSDDGRKRGYIIGADGDPEGDPGFGMGNLPYAAPKRVPLTGVMLAEPRPADAAAGEIHNALATPGPSIRVLPEIRDALVSHYRQQNFRPLWIGGGKFSARGLAVLKVLASAGEEGLEADSYLPAVLTAFDAPLPETDPAAMALLDIELSAAALKYSRDASGGQFDPRRLSLYNDVTPAWIAPALVVKVLAWSPYAAEYMKSLHPAHPAYVAMKAELARLMAEENQAVIAPIAEGPIVKKGKSDARIPAVRQRLSDLGFPDAMMAAMDPLVLDADLSVDLRLFQKASGIKVTGALGPQTLAALNADTGTRDAARLRDNMERLRWLPKSLGARHVFVNQAAFEVQVVDNGIPAWTSRVIVGKPLTQTSVFHDQMETVVFNPSWGVPPSIIANEYLPKLRDDPGYLDRIGFKVVDGSGKAVSSSSIDWWSYGNKVPFGIQQPPGAKNALGEIKFLFPNAHNIYMHDTPNRELFDNDVRAFSHGCVRVENPREFASVLLGWNPEEVDAKIDSQKSQSVKLDAKIPVHITYFTAWPDDTGKIVYFNDIYGRDKTMDSARSAIVMAER